MKNAAENPILAGKRSHGNRRLNSLADRACRNTTRSPVQDKKGLADKLAKTGKTPHVQKTTAVQEQQSAALNRLPSNDHHPWHQNPIPTRSLRVSKNRPRFLLQTQNQRVYFATFQSISALRARPANAGDHSHLALKHRNTPTRTRHTPKTRQSDNSPTAPKRAHLVNSYLNR